MKSVRQQVTNTSGLSELQTTLVMRYGTKLGTFTNRWRQREVTLYAHPHDRHKVLSVGVGFGEAQHTTTICSEKRAEYPRQLEQNDWSPFN